jgi:hypothetical protein
MSIEQIHLALEQGHKVNWVNSLYELAYVRCEDKNPYGKASYKKGKAIRVSCITNYFGSLIHESEFKNCFLKTP